MVVKILVFLIVFGGGGYLLFSLLRKAWRNAEVRQRLEDIEDNEELYREIKQEDVQEAQEVRETIDEFLDEAR